MVDVTGRSRPKPASEVDADTEIRLTVSVSGWVNRAAAKLVAALDAWPIEVEGRRALDVGASTGGFTEVLLARGARHVVALDVGHGQLHPRVAADARVDNREGTSIRDLTPADLEPVAIVVADLSFISVCLATAPIADVVEPGGDVVLLIKPQFEVGRARLGKNGVVSEPAHRADAIRQVVACAQASGLHPHGLTGSPVTGTHGNEEYLLWLRPDPSGRMDARGVESTIAAVTAVRSRPA